MRTTNHTINRVGDWIRGQLIAHTLAEQEGNTIHPKVVAFSLSHQAGGVVKTETGAKVMVGSGVDPIDTAAFFWEKAVAYASGLTGGSGMQQFIIESHAEGHSSPIAHYPMKAQGAQELDAIMSSEPATTTGIVTQLMRHTEHAVSALASMNQQLMATVTQLTAQSQDVIQKGYSNLELTERLIIAAAEGEHQKRLELITAQSKEDMKRKLLGLAPAGLNAIFEREIFPTAMADTSIIEAIAEDMSADDLEMLQVMLTAKVKNKEVLGLLFNRLTKIIEEKQRSQLNGGETLTAPTQ